MWSAQRFVDATRLLLIFLLGIGPKLARGVRCYCTDDNCASYGVCEADVCVVGILKANNAVIRTCADEPLGCQKSIGKWSDVCACTESFCNTYSYLRASTSRDRDHERTPNDDDLVFHRMDRPYDFSADFDDPNDSSTISRKSMPPVLLVVVPFVVGVTVVIIVSFNYYCHLC